MSSQLPATTDLTLERILAPLIDVFPGGATAERVRIYADLLRPEGFDLADVREGVSRLIHVWDRTTFPSFARLLSCCNNARELRITVERLNAKKREDGQQFRKLPQELLDAQLAEIRKLRLRAFPKKEPNIRTDKEHRRKVLGYKLLTQAEIDMLNRKKREREKRARHPEAPETSPPNGAEDAPS